MLKKIDKELRLVRQCLTVSNDGRITRLATKPGDSDGVINLELISSSDATSTKWDVLRAHDSDHMSCIVLIQKGNMVTQ